MDPIIDKEPWRAKYRAAMEALQGIYDRELREMTEEEALRKIMSLCTCEPPWRERPDWSGLVDQQAAFMRGMKR